MCTYAYDTVYIYMCIYIDTYISAEASMASGRLEGRLPIHKTLSSPQSGEGFPPLTPPTAPARPFSENLEPFRPPKNLILAATRATFPCLGSPRSPQGPPRTPRTPQKFHQDPQGPPKDLTRTPKDPLRHHQGPPGLPQEPPNAQNTTIIPASTPKITQASKWI